MGHGYSYVTKPRPGARWPFTWSTDTSPQFSYNSAQIVGSLSHSCTRPLTMILQQTLWFLLILRGFSLQENTGIPYFLVFHRIVLCRYCFLFFGFFFCKLKVCGNPALSEPIGAIFPKHLLTSCLCVTFWKFSQYFTLFHYCYICYGDL